MFFNLFFFFIPGGFSEFAYKFPKLCDSKIKSSCLLSISTPCASAGSLNCPPTKVLPFLYLGSEVDAQSEDILKTCRVKYILNASHTAVDSPYCKTGHYLKIPIKDNSSENIVAWFQTAFDFIGKSKLRASFSFSASLVFLAISQSFLRRRCGC